uniref:Small ribosomal subunit protein uS2c n=1 Tax=Gloeotilopsis sterilis TaxID=160069 RepID=A0A097KNQ2_GLOST|nr:ribosomal protein S2 [Gloeotilopsis sterilis]AIT94801.1 ribosomal protein S2 [Gloeotilopsis sterilis]
MISIDEMAQVGMHFGHQARKWNPRMAPYIYTEKNGIHIIDLIKTYYFLKQVCKFLTESAFQGKTFLFVGTKKQASRLIAKTALQANSFYVNQRWLGGMLTNWKTIKTSILKLNELETREKNGELKTLPKKEAAACKKEKDRLQKYLGGLKNMTKIPDIVIIVGQPEELNAVKECKKLGLTTITILDTDCDPNLADYFVPANDDSVASIQLLLNLFLESIQRGQNQYIEKQKKVDLQKRSVKKVKNS